MQYIIKQSINIFFKIKAIHKTIVQPEPLSHKDIDAALMMTVTVFVLEGTVVATGGSFDKFCFFLLIIRTLPPPAKKMEEAIKYTSNTTKK